MSNRMTSFAVGVAALGAAAAVAHLTFASAAPLAGPVLRPSTSVAARAALGASELPGDGASTLSAGISAGANGLVAAAAVLMLRAAARTRRRSGRVAKRTVAARAAEMEYGQDLAMPDDAFCALGVAHCFEQVDGKLKDVWVLEPLTASTVEVIQNGCRTSHETYIGTTVGQILKRDTSLFPKELLNGHEVQFGENLEFRTGCAARTWMRDHARDVVRLLAPMGEVKTDFNVSVADKRILNFVNEVKDGDNVKQDMSIDVYGRAEEDIESSSAIDDLYNA